MGKPTMWFSNRSDINRPVQAQKRARSLKFRISVEEELYYPCSKKKGADQLRGYREADLRLCFRICRLLVFPRGGSYLSHVNLKTSIIFLDFFVSNFNKLLIENKVSSLHIENQHYEYIIQQEKKKSFF